MVGLKAGLIAALPKSNEISLASVSFKRSSRTRSSSIGVVGALARQLLAQLRLLAVHQIADAGAGRRAGGGADDRAAHPIALVEPIAEHAAGNRADTRADRGLVHGLGAVRVRGASGEQQGTQSRARLHAHSRFPPQELHSEADR